jgi:hypothetical protein
MSQTPESSTPPTPLASPSTPRWTRHLPEAFGIRRAVEASKYRWCVREAALWGIATGTATSLHRLRMRSTTTWAINTGFGAFLVVYVGSYVFCVQRRDYRERMISLMMQLNSFEHAISMPEPTPVDEHHPFVAPAGTEPDAATIPAERQYIANLPERKEWQPPLPTRDAQDVFQPKP